MLGRASWMRLPDIVGVELTSRPQAGITCTDIVLALTEFLRQRKVVGAYIEFLGAGASALTIGDRATISNMTPNSGATAAMFYIDGQTTDYLTLTGREDSQVKLVETYARQAGLWADDLAGAQYERMLRFDLSSVVRNMAGPSNPHKRVATTELAERGIAGPWQETPGQMPDGAVIIAAITSCTNTSNPRNVIAAALLARNANRAGLTRKPWVKSSLAPGSKAVQLYLEEAGLLPDLEKLGFGIVAFACTTCNGMSGALDPKIQQEIVDRDLYATAVLSGNRNFDGRIHPYAKQAFLASPPLVIAYAIAGTVRFDIEKDALGVDASGKPVTLKDIWPSDAEIDAVVAASVKPEQFQRSTSRCSASPRSRPARSTRCTTGARKAPTSAARPIGKARWPGSARSGHAPAGRAGRQHHHRPPVAVQRHHGRQRGGRVPGQDGPAGRGFQLYATHRGDHLTAQRATFANPKLINEMAVVDGQVKQGSLARLEPEGKVMRMWETIETYMDRKQPLIIIAGADYGQGSSRDWAAKGVRLAGVEAIVAEGFERIHRTNLIGMGVLPLEFQAGVDRKTLGIDGTETFDVVGERVPRATLTLVIHRRDGEQVQVPVTCRLDTAEEVSIYEAGGVLQRFAQDFLESTQTT